MRKLRWSLVLACFLVVAACGGDDDAEDTTTSTAATTTTTAAATTTTAALPTGNPLTGGLLYDKWWKVTGADEPTTDQALWATQSENTRSGGDTWRCKECHGWDYKGADGAYGSGSHFTGFAGVFGSRGKSAADLTAAMTSGDHDFSSLLTEQNIADLVAFIQQDLEDYGQFIAADKGIIGGDVANGETHYKEACVACHGADGTQINFGDDDDPEFLATIAIGNPWEFFHKVRFGQPGSNPPMPASEAVPWTLEHVRDVVAYAQTLPTEIVDADAAVLGGLLYDKWWTAAGLDEPTDDNPIWARQTTNERSGGDTWRCKECHGWDYQGSAGAYSSGSHFTGFPGIFAAQDKSAEEIIAQLTGQVDPDHDFSVLSASDVAALAAFVRTGLLDMPAIIDLETKAPLGGDLAAGEALYASSCTACHGDDGTAVNFGDEADPEYVGGLSAGNPWEVAHKILFGHPGSSPVMPAQINNGWGPQEIVDILTYLQTLP